jgi:site-specific recombinase
LVRGTGAEPQWVFGNWRREIEAALLILGARLGALGTLPEVRDRLSYGRDAQEIPFIRISLLLADLIRALNSSDLESGAFARFDRECDACLRAIEKVYAAMEHTGVSVGLVYTLESLANITRRITLLVRFLDPGTQDRAPHVVKLISAIVSDRVTQSTLTGLVKVNLTLIARKIVERAGDSGEHYITRSRSEYFSMLRSGIGAGVFMVLTTIVKYSLAALQPALFFEGLFFSANYSASFVLLQLMGFTLATKQPSATASALAGKLVHLEEEDEVREFVNEACRMTRTQFASLVGNLVGLIPAALAVDLAAFAITKHHIFSHHTAEHVLASLHPLTSLTVPMAAWTGVLLWLSSIAAGWFENWIVFRRIPEALASNRRLIRVFGEHGARRIGDWTQRNATLLAGNISLGFLLGFTAVTGIFLGLPLDVRHVTLSAASLVFAVASLFGPKLAWQSVIGPVVGIFLIGFLNFAVSYSLALAVAARARDVKLGVVRRLLRAMRIRLRHRPSEYFLPPTSGPKKPSTAVTATALAEDTSGA